MTDDQKALVRADFALLQPKHDQAAALFYDRLFQMDPALRPLFKADMVEQGRKLMAMIGTAVANLDRLDAVVPAIRQLGTRHVGYGVKDGDYDTVGGALLWTLAAGLGDAFTPDHHAAWTACYTVLAGVMKDAAINGRQGTP